MSVPVEGGLYPADEGFESGLEPGDVSRLELRRLYDDYRSRQARALLSLIPRTAVRPLYRRALQAADTGGSTQKDPMAILLAFCEALLPLPSFDVWLADRRQNPEA
ncbi:MAG: hypothetical protein R3253_11735, partial [Longimicrobiales bacterium]|nr:hypothetical protein [Longimicrobiales bacterium]